MYKRIIAWLVIVLMSAVLFIFDSCTATISVLIVSIIVPFTVILFSMQGTKKIELIITAPDRCTVGDTIECTVSTKGKRAFHDVKAEIRIANVHTGEETVYKHSVSTKTESIELTALHCGTVVFEVTHISISDVLGLICRRKKCGVVRKVIVMPELCNMDIGVAQSDMAMPESNEYSPTKPGYDPSETFGIREYIPGDSIKSIHWKLSQKTDRAMIREFGLPVINQILLILDIPASADYVQINAMTEVFCSISASLAEKGVSHTLMWAADEVVKRTVSNVEDFMETLDEVLSAQTNGECCFDVEAEKDIGGYAHIAYVGTEYKPELEDRFNGSQITEILCDSSANAVSNTNERIRILSVDSKSWRKVLNSFDI